MSFARKNNSPLSEKAFLPPQTLDGFTPSILQTELANPPKDGDGIPPEVSDKGSRRVGNWSRRSQTCSFAPLG